MMPRQKCLASRRVVLENALNASNQIEVSGNISLTISQRNGF